MRSLSERPGAEPGPGRGVQRPVRIVCAPVLSGLDAAIQLPGHLGSGHLGSGLLAYGAPTPPRPIPPLFLHSIRPALECAFGTEDADLAPDALAALVTQLHAGPLGPAPADASPATAEA